jgi:hypothetical protein
MARVNEKALKLILIDAMMRAVGGRDTHAGQVQRERSKDTLRSESGKTTVAGIVLRERYQPYLWLCTRRTDMAVHGCWLICRCDPSIKFPPRGGRVNNDVWLCAAHPLSGWPQWQ